jgi:hypothetical protein
MGMGERCAEPPAVAGEAPSANLIVDYYDRLPDVITRCVVDPTPVLAAIWADVLSVEVGVDDNSRLLPRRGPAGTQG